MVDHDLGTAPCAVGTWCTLVNCKFSRLGKVKNIVESARERDWVVGTGGLSAKSSGHGTIIYAMKVTEVLTLTGYYNRKEFSRRADFPQSAPQDDPLRNYQRMALISDQFVYFGRMAVPVSSEVLAAGEAAGKPLEKRGPKYRCSFPPEFVKEFEKWYLQLPKKGIVGWPCGKPEEKCSNPCSEPAQKKP